MTATNRLAVMTKIGIISILLFATGIAVAAEAHSWYPQECCSGRDCAPVRAIDQTMTKDGVMHWVLTGKHGKAAVPKNFPMRESHDARMHVCMRYDPFGDLKVICIFVPPSM